MTRTRRRTDYASLIQEHYEAVWRNEAQIVAFSKGPIHELPEQFRVLKFRPSDRRRMWTYATKFMSKPEDRSRLELHVFAREPNDDLAELLAAVAHYHRTATWLGLGHTVNFGRPWWPGSACDRGLISLPYLDGPELEWLDTSDGRTRFLWLIPVTINEVEFKKKSGLEALERMLEKEKFNYLDPFRMSVV